MGNAHAAGAWRARVRLCTQVNVTDAADTVGGSRFWMWMRENCGGSIYDGYLHVINTVVRACPAAATGQREQGATALSVYGAV